MARSARQTSAARFRRRIHRSNELHASYLGDARLLAAYDRFTQWQLDYLLQFFEDLYAEEGYKEAIDFTMRDLAGIGIADRDLDLERVAPVITMMLPAGAMQTLARATRMNVLVLELNIAVCEALMTDGKLPDEISERAYWSAFRRATRLEDCLELVSMSTELGNTLKSLVRHGSLALLLRGMRGPAHAAGFGALHDFLESGYHTFRRIPHVGHFLAVIESRMTEIFDRIHNAPLDGSGEVPASNRRRVDYRGL